MLSSGTSYLTKRPIVQHYGIVEAFCVNVERNPGQFGSLKDDIQMHHFGQKIILAYACHDVDNTLRDIKNMKDSPDNNR